MSILHQITLLWFVKRWVCLFECRSTLSGRWRMDLYFSRRQKILHLARRYRLCSSSTRHSVMLESWSGLFKQHSFASLLFWLLFSSLQAVCSAIKLKIVVHFCINFFYVAIWMGHFHWTRVLVSMSSGWNFWHWPVF